MEYDEAERYGVLDGVPGESGLRALVAHALHGKAGEVLLVGIEACAPLKEQEQFFSQIPVGTCLLEEQYVSCQYLSMAEEFGR